MPRRTINNELDAAKFIADMALKVAAGKKTCEELQSCTNAMNSFGSLKKQMRDARRERINQAYIDSLRDDVDRMLPRSIGHRIDFHEQISKMKIK